MAVEFVDGVSWQERERLLDSGAVHAGWICGLPYVRKSHHARPGIELLAAPVMAASRYMRRPVYFSDIVVRRDSTVRSFSDLRGSRWAYNEPGSHSGYNIVRYQLARLSEDASYFGHVTATGAHQRTLWMIAAGQVDASAIDSTVLEREFRLRPSLARALHVIETWGPSPAPPWVVSKRLPAAIRLNLRSLLLSMHRESDGRALLRHARMARFVSVSDADYDPIRNMDRAAGDVML
jgi:phosphonate transport system substrate-binding protein